MSSQDTPRMNSRQPSTWRMTPSTLASGKPRGGVETELELIAEIGGCMRDASICGLGQAASSAVESAIDRLGVFKEGAR